MAARFRFLLTAGERRDEQPREVLGALVHARNLVARKTDQQTADIIGISRWTVVAHVQSAKSMDLFAAGWIKVGAIHKLPQVLDAARVLPGEHPLLQHQRMAVAGHLGGPMAAIRWFAVCGQGGDAGFGRSARLLDELGQDDDLLAFHTALNVLGIVRHQRDATHRGAALGGEIGALHVQVLDQGDGIARFQRPRWKRQPNMSALVM